MVAPIPPPPGPYTYNDSRICYNEPCFVYNGGFDLVCLRTLQPPTRRPGKSTVGRKTYPEPEMVDLLFKTCITCVNDEEFKKDEQFNEKYCTEKRYKFKKDVDITVKASDVHVKIKSVPQIVGKLTKSRPSETSISSSNEVVKLERKKTTMSSSLHKLKTTVSSSLKLNRPRKITIKSDSIKVKKKE